MKTAGAWLAIAAVAVSFDCAAQATDTCSVSILNQTAYVRPDGTWRIPNVPANMGLVRARLNCAGPSGTASGISDLFEITPNVLNGIPEVRIGDGPPMPVAVDLTFPAGTSLTTAGDQAQLQVVATYPGGWTADVTARATGTTYFSSNTAAATVDADGLVTAHRSGRTLLGVLHEAIVSTEIVDIILSGDADADGMADDWETANGLDPANPADALEDPDGDGLLNIDEFGAGTEAQDPDTDGDDILDGEEAVAGLDGWVTSPGLADTDADCLRDPLEIAMGTDPTDRSSGSMGLALDHLEIEPVEFTLYVNTALLQESSRLLHVQGVMIDGSRCEVTSFPSVSYYSSDILVAGFGAERGRVIAGNEGVATVEARLLGRSATTEVTVLHVAPEALGFVRVPGRANDVARWRREGEAIRLDAAKAGTARNVLGRVFYSATQGDAMVTFFDIESAVGSSTVSAVTWASDFATHYIPKL